MKTIRQGNNFRERVGVSAPAGRRAAAAQKANPLRESATASYTVKQVADMSGATIRALRFYDQIGLLKPARHGASGRRYYQEPQLLTLQQILFYRELGLPLKEIREILRRRAFDKIPALEAHRQTLQHTLNRTRQLIETIDNTIQHLKGRKQMKTTELFAGFTIPADNARFGERFQLGGKGGEPADCKLSGKDTAGALAIFEFTGHSGGPRVLHHEQDEWLYVITGQIHIQVAEKTFGLSAGESIFIPRNTPHVWSSFEAAGAKILNSYAPAGKIEDFFRELVKPPEFMPTKEQTITNNVGAAQLKALHGFFADYGMDLMGPPLMAPPRD